MSAEKLSRFVPEGIYLDGNEQIIAAFDALSRHALGSRALDSLHMSVSGAYALAPERDACRNMKIYLHGSEQKEELIDSLYASLQDKDLSESERSAIADLLISQEFGIPR